MAQKELEQLFSQLQMQNQHLQTIAMQRQALSMQSKEIESALEALETADSDVFKSVGPILLKTTKEAVKKDLTEEKEEIDLKLSALERQEKRSKEKIKEIQERFSQIVPKDNAGQGG